MTVADPNSDKTRAAIDPIVPLAVLAGAALALVTNLASNTDIGGPGWTLRGNGALIVLFAGGGALLAFGWLALAFGADRQTGWLNRAALGAAVTLILELGFVFLPIAFGPDRALFLLLPLIVGVLAVALLTGVALATGGYTTGAMVALVALLASLAPLGLQFFLVPLFLPVIVAAPALGRALNGWLIANSLAMLLALLVGIYVAQLVTNR
jgi:hypothetical protein